VQPVAVLPEAGLIETLWVSAALPGTKRLRARRVNNNQKLTWRMARRERRRMWRERSSSACCNDASRPSSYRAQTPTTAIQRDRRQHQCVARDSNSVHRQLGSTRTLTRARANPPARATPSARAPRETPATAPVAASWAGLHRPNEGALAPQHPQACADSADGLAVAAAGAAASTARCPSQK
jgi:hypothetical protein